MSVLLAALLALPPAPAAAAVKASEGVERPVLSVPALPQALSPVLPPNAAPLDLAGASHVVFDVRGERGGHGDVAAGYLTAADIVDRAYQHGALASLPE